KVFRMLKRSDNGVARALENPDDTTLAPMPARRRSEPDWCFGEAASIFAETLRNVATNPHHDAVAVHGGAGVLGGDENVLRGRYSGARSKASTFSRIVRPFLFILTKP